jgi:hypothetical protein
MPGAMNSSEKQARLAQALRDNLRRRKAQARAAEEAPAAAPQAGQPESPPSSE